MRILFCKIAFMKYYKGVQENVDEPRNGGSYVTENRDGGEVYNFDAVSLEGREGEYCLGFVETKSTRKDRKNELHIEKIQGCEALKNEEAVEDVLVVWCATTPHEETSIMGWYHHATVYRHYQQCDFGNDFVQDYNVIAKKDDCVLLPEGTRRRYIWDAPVSKKRTYGFGQSLIWYAQEENAKPYIEKLIKQIQEYDGENWIDVGYPEL